MKHGFSFFLSAILLAATTGCGLVESGRSSMTEMKRMFRPRPFDGPVTQEDIEDEWGFVGQEGRAGQERERDPDPFWKNSIMSARARNIERNLGFD